MSLFDDTINLVNKGIEGGNIGLPMGFNRLIEFVPNIQQGTYYLIGGETGSGKTAFVDDAFLYNPFDWLYGNPDSKIKLKVIYYSFEIEKRRKIIKAICRKLFIDYNIIVDVNYVLSRGKNRISNEIYQKVISTKEYFDKMEDILTIHDIPKHSTSIKIDLDNFFKQNGKINKVSEFKSEYIPNDNNLYTICIIDHIGLSKKNNINETNKLKIDNLSSMLYELRNKYNLIPVVISQLNRSISSSDRFKLEMIRPQLSDFKETGNTQEDANIIMCLFNPYRYQIGNYDKYNINILQDRFRGLSILKIVMEIVIYLLV